MRFRRAAVVSASAVRGPGEGAGLPWGHLPDLPPIERRAQPAESPGGFWVGPRGGLTGSLGPEKAEPGLSWMLTFSLPPVF